MYPGGILWKNLLSSFTMCPSIWSKCAHWVLCKVPTTSSQCGSIFPQTLKEPSKCPLGTFWSNWWAHCERTQRVLSQNTLLVLSGHFLKEQRGFVQKVPTGFCAGYFLKVPTTYLLGMSQANWWALFENDQYLPAGYELGKLFQNPQLTHNVPTGYIALHPQWEERSCEVLTTVRCLGYRGMKLVATVCGRNEERRRRKGVQRDQEMTEKQDEMRSGDNEETRWYETRTRTRTSPHCVGILGFDCDKRFAIAKLNWDCEGRADGRSVRIQRS